MALTHLSGPLEPGQTTELFLASFHYFSPIALFIVLAAAFLYYSRANAQSSASMEPQQLGPGGKPLPRGLSPSAKAKKASEEVDFSPGRKFAFIWLSVSIMLTFIGNAILVVIQALEKDNRNWWCGKEFVVYVVGSFFLYSLIVASLVDTKPSPVFYHVVTWIWATVTEILGLTATFLLYSRTHHEPTAGGHNDGRLEKSFTMYEAIEFGLDGSRLTCLLFLTILYTGSKSRHHKYPKRRHAGADTPVDETTRLLDDQDPMVETAGYSAHHSTDSTINGETTANPKVVPSINTPLKDVDEDAGWARPEKIPPKNWWEYVSAYSLFIPYLWPARNTRLQAYVVVCFILMVLASGVNLLVPIAAGRIIDALAGEEGSPFIPTRLIFVFIGLKLLQGSSGILSAVREYLWIPVSQHSYLELSVAGFEHVHSLSLEFHLGKKTGEVLSALNKGASINTFLGQITFQFFPMLVDLSIAIVFFSIEFDTYYALTVAITAFAYIYVTIRMAAWRSPIRREMTNLDRAAEGVKNDSLTSYETVRYFGAVGYEVARFRRYVLHYQLAEFMNNSSLNLMNVVQNSIFTLGLLVTCFIAAYQVETEQIPVGKFVVLLTYMSQLQGPLNFLGSFYRTLQQSMINAERLLELFKEHPTVVDHVWAEDLPYCHGDINFKDVKFSYDPRRPALDGFNLKCPAGTTTALVGESGGGKSTIFRLLFRHYNIQSGALEIDDKNVETIKIESLRSHMGVVPQDTMLFNETLMYNLKYANRDLKDEQVFAACRSASIHDQILSFPDGYDTVVGDRGLKLSGGEKQRIAIARTILKGPRIILLDEATAALDTKTEQDIETAIKKLSGNCTMIIIAHRLSTIAQADQIAVLHAGKVAELGSHDELIRLNGRYASMWRKQIRTENAMKEAKVLTDRAEQIRSDAETSDSANQSEDERERSIRRGVVLEETAASRAVDESEWTNVGTDL